MKAIRITSLKEGDWITDYGENFRDKKGKFAIARVEVFKLIFDKSIFIDMDKNKVKEVKDCGITFENLKQGIIKLDEKDLKDFKKMENKLKILEGLKEERRFKE